METRAIQSLPEGHSTPAGALPFELSRGMGFWKGRVAVIILLFALSEARTGSSPMASVPINPWQAKTLGCRPAEIRNLLQEPGIAGTSIWSGFALFMNSVIMDMSSHVASTPSMEIIRAEHGARYPT